MKAQDDLQRNFFRPDNGYTMQGAGHTDLYKLFCERYSYLARTHAHIGVVLPRAALINDGSRGFRQWLYTRCTPTSIVTMRNRSKWAFEMEVRYTIALVCAQVDGDGAEDVSVVGPSRDAGEFGSRLASPPVKLRLRLLQGWTNHDATGQVSGWETPLLQSQRHVDVLARLQQGVRFDAIEPPATVESAAQLVGHRRPIPHQGDMNEKNQKSMYNNPPGEGRVPVWKGRSFDQFDPHGREPAGYSDWGGVLDFVHRRRQSPRSAFKGQFASEVLDDPSTHPIHRARVAFRDASRATDSRTVIACMVPPRTPLTHKSPYLIANPVWSRAYESVTLGVFNSVCFDWFARRYVETSVSFFLLNMLCFPRWDNTEWPRIGTLAARLSCVDERFADFADEAGVEYGELSKAEHDDMRAEIDALVAQGYELNVDDLRFIFTDFTLGAVPEHYRDLVVAKFEALS